MNGSSWWYVKYTQPLNNIYRLQVEKFYIFSGQSIFPIQWCALCVWAVYVLGRPEAWTYIYVWWRGCAAPEKKFSLASCAKKDIKILPGLVRTVLLSRNIYFICPYLLVFAPAQSENGPFYEILKTNYLWSRPEVQHGNGGENACHHCERSCWQFFTGCYCWR